MKTCETPIEIWYSDPNMRPFLKRSQIIVEEDGNLVIPMQKCTIEKPSENGKMSRSETKMFPFFHQKLLLMLDSMQGDYVRAIETFNPQNRSFMCGKNLDIIVTLQ